MMNGDTTLESLLSSTAFSHISEELNKKKTQLRVQFKTNQLWLAYQQLLGIAQAMTKADRTESWENHLCAICDALPIFAAAPQVNNIKI
jgi:hypothetical protein